MCAWTRELPLARRLLLAADPEDPPQVVLQDAGRGYGAVVAQGYADDTEAVAPGMGALRQTTPATERWLTNPGEQNGLHWGSRAAHAARAHIRAARHGDGGQGPAQAATWGGSRGCGDQLRTAPGDLRGGRHVGTNARSEGEGGGILLADAGPPHVADNVRAVRARGGGGGAGLDREACRHGLRVARSELEASLLRRLVAGATWTAERAA